VKNEDIFGPVENNGTLAVIVVQVHNRIQYLRQLIISFSQAKDIDRTLIIFSHDIWDDEVNELINSVDFAKTLQIFYPCSIQTHTNAFPGESPNDCPRNAKKDQAERLGCINSKWPDLYGHYREAKFTQTKHHWWWKANRIFNELRATMYYNGLVLFLEEDHFAAEDFLSVLSLMKNERDLRYPNCDILCLGTYLKQTNYKEDHRKVELTQWLSSKHNMGMAFTRDVWNKIHLCSANFCQFDDYNWDWSLFHVSMTCLKQKLQVMLIKGPRVFHIGECGVHHKKAQCETEKVVKKVQAILEKANPFLYPKNLVVITAQAKKNVKLPKGNGGWGDKRDQLMCLNMSTYNSTLLHEQLGESFGL
jgi:alpha-1,6-mannosyl-glycoprotein beta-1,2-N-acetylglucosaminyltransferase